MPDPIFTFAFIISTIIGASFHFIFGGDAKRLALFLFTAWMGFALGHYIGVGFELNFVNIGALRFMPATITAIVLLVFAHIFTSGRSRQISRR